MSGAERQGASRLAITGIGMESSLGGAVTACAAARAGMVRARLLPFTTGMDGEEPVQLSGHPCPEVQGFEGFGRLCYLTRLALDDLLARWSPGRVPPVRIAVLINLPTSDERPLLLEHLVRVGAITPGALEVDVFLGMLRPLMPEVLRGASLHVIHGGHAGGAEALRKAEVLLYSGHAEVCLVGGVDSYLDVPTLEWLDATRRLKTPGRPVGMMPGEGAAFLAVERRAVSREQDSSALAFLGPLSLAGQKPSGDEDEGSLPGEALASALRDVLERNPGGDREIRILIHDLNGQDVRANDWGHALLRSSRSFPRLGQMTLWLPVVSFGDVGCATAFFLACVAVRAFARGYALGRQILVSCGSEQGARAAFIVAMGPATRAPGEVDPSSPIPPGPCGRARGALGWRR